MPFSQVRWHGGNHFMPCYAGGHAMSCYVIAISHVLCLRVMYSMLSAYALCHVMLCYASLMPLCLLLYYTMLCHVMRMSCAMSCQRHVIRAEVLFTLCHSGRYAIKEAMLCLRYAHVMPLCCYAAASKAPLHHAMLAPLRHYNHAIIIMPCCCYTYYAMLC
jgi:hypothetical protein